MATRIKINSSIEDLYDVSLLNYKAEYFVVLYSSNNYRPHQFTLVYDIDTGAFKKVLRTKTEERVLEIDELLDKSEIGLISSPFSGLWSDYIEFEEAVSILGKNPLRTLRWLHDIIMETNPEMRTFTTNLRTKRHILDVPAIEKAIDGFTTRTYNVQYLHGQIHADNSIRMIGQMNVELVKSFVRALKEDYYDKNPLHRFKLGRKLLKFMSKQNRQAS